jgi:hypothetical protein
MRWALTALLLSTTALADPSATLLPKNAPAPAIEWTPARKAAAVGIAAGAIVTSLAFVAFLVFFGSLRVTPLPSPPRSAGPVS